uniref:Uncharacterized protein n=1 Tax=Tetranychus urticae TaxID=32264 RepID=T1KZ26_TETUR
MIARKCLYFRPIHTSHPRRQVDGKRIIEFFKDWNDPAVSAKIIIPAMVMSGFFAFWLNVGIQSEHTPDPK